MSDRKLQVIPLGGLGEFGMNSMALRYGDDIVVIDAGMMFPDAELLGVDIVTPDFAYLEEHRSMVRALLLTHGHEDHIGGIPFLLAQMNIPIYGTDFTLALVERRLEEHDLDKKAVLNRVKAGEKIELGAFAVEFIRVTHFDDVGVCFDTGHAHMMSDVAQTFESLKNHIHSTHVHDNAKERDSHLWPGAGTIDWKQTLELLNTAPHRPPLLLEIEGDEKINPVEKMNETFGQLVPA